MGKRKELETEEKVSLAEEYLGGRIGMREDRRGRRVSDQTPRAKEEALRIENARLKRENELLTMELYLRKKVKELERGNR